MKVLLNGGSFRVLHKGACQTALHKESQNYIQYFNWLTGANLQTEAKVTEIVLKVWFNFH